MRVARNRESGVTIEQIAKNFGVHPMTLQKWMRRAEIDEGAKPGQSHVEGAELRKALENAVAMRGDVAGCVVHPDRGSQFRSRKFLRAMTRHHSVKSMGRVGSSGDNAATEILLSVSNARSRALEEPEDVSCVVPLQAPHRFSLGLAIDGSASEVLPCLGMDLRSRHDCGVKGAVELPVAAAGEAMPSLILPGRGLQGGGSSEAGEGCFVTTTPRVRPGDEDLGCDERADAGLGKERRSDLMHDREHRVLKFPALDGEVFDPRRGAAK